MSEANYSVYRITNNVNGKLYFGLTKRNISERMKQHRYSANRGAKFLISRAIKKYGWSCFSVDIIESGLTKDEACSMEIRLIKQSGSCYENGYNMMPGGQVGISLRPETKARKSKSAKKAWQSSEKWREAINNPERLKKISEASKRNWADPEYREKLLNNPRRVNAIKSAAKDPAVRDAAKNTFGQNGFSRPVRNCEGTCFDFCSDAAKWVRENTRYKSASPSNILACARGRRKSAYGFKWVFR